MNSLMKRITEPCVMGSRKNMLPAILSLGGRGSESGVDGQDMRGPRRGVNE